MLAFANLDHDFLIDLQFDFGAGLRYPLTCYADTALLYESASLSN